MRKLKQATQREKARRELKEKKDRVEGHHHDRPAPKSMKASARNGHPSSGGTTSTAGRRSDKTTFH